MWPDVTLARRPWRGQGTGRRSDQGEAQSGEIHLHLGRSIDGVRNGFWKFKMGIYIDIQDIYDIFDICRLSNLSIECRF